jgi:hypothetical protein
MVTKVNGTKGKNGKNSAKPTNGTDGGDATSTTNGTIGLDSTTIQANGGDGGNGGDNTGPSGAGGNGGNGGNASITANGNIFKPASKSFALDATATGGMGGDAGANAGPIVGGSSGGNGGNATVTLNGNIIQTSAKLSSITIDAEALAGLGGGGSTHSSAGNAKATISGNIVQYSGTAATNVFVSAFAALNGPDDFSHNGDPSYGTKTATVTGNIVSGNVNSVTLSADAEFSNASAVLSGNIVTAGKTNTGTVTLEATGQTIDIEQNKINLGKQELDLTINEYTPYNVTIKGNDFEGTGMNTFVFTDNAVPGPSPDMAAVDLGAGTFTFNGMSNKLKGFENVTMAGNGNYTFTGDANDNILTGGSGNDTFIASAGNDTYNGGAGSDTLKFLSSTGPLTVDLGNPNPQMIGGGYGNDTLVSIENVDTSATSSNNVLIGSASDNTLIGGSGHDILFGHGGTNTLTGGAGTDVAYYLGRETQYGTAALTAVTGGPEAVNDTLSGVERLKFLSPAHVSDVTNDGLGDLIYQNANTGRLEVLVSGGGSPVTVASTAVNINSTNTTWNAIGTGQFTPDATGPAARASGILLQNTATQDLEVITSITAATPTTTAVGTAGAFTGYTAITAGDFNGDAASDILLQNAAGATEIAFLNGTAGSPIGTVDSIQAVTGGPGAGWKAVSSGDFNTDGKSDILYQNTTTGAVEVDLMNGSKVTSSADFNTTGLTAIGTGDFNGDGKSDILFQAANGSAVIWTMDGTTNTGSFTAAKPGTANQAYVVKGAEDIDGNGVSDILWQLNGNTYATLENGAGVGTNTLVPNTPATAFHLVASTGGG